jgi:hypothetical protein
MGKKSKIWNNAYDYLKGLDPNAKINFSKLNKKLKSKIKKIMVTRTKKRGFNNGENSGLGLGNLKLAGISKLKNSGAQGPSKKYLKAQKIADQKAKQIAEELEKEYTEGMKQKSENKKKNKKRDRIELAKLSRQQQEDASTFIQNVQSNTYSKEQLMQNFCRIQNEGTRDNIVVQAFIPRFIKNIEQIHNILQDDSKLELLEKNYFEFEARYKKIFKVFHELQLKFYDILHVQIDLNELLNFLGMDIQTLNDIITNINDNGFNYDIVYVLKKWIETFKKRALEKYEDLNIESLQEEFILETQYDIEPILKEIFLRIALLGINEELSADNFTKIMGKIAKFHHPDSIPKYILQIINILKSDGNIKTFYEKYDIGYFTPEEKEEVKSLISRLAEELQFLQNQYDDDIKVNKLKQDNEISDLKNELESFKASTNNSNQSKKNIKEKEEEIDKVKEKYHDIFKILNQKLQNQQNKLLQDLEEKLIVIHKNASQRFTDDSNILRRHFKLKKEFEGGGPNNGKKPIKSKWTSNKPAAKLLGEQEEKRQKNANENAQFVRNIADAVGKRALENLPSREEARRLLKEAIRLTEEAKLSKLNSKKSYAELFGEQVLKARRLAKEAKLSKWNSKKSAAELLGEQEQKRKKDAKSVSNIADAAIKKATSKEKNPWFSRYPLAQQISRRLEIDKKIKEREAKRLAEEAKLLAEKAKLLAEKAKKNKKAKKLKEDEVAKKAEEAKKAKEDIKEELKQKTLELAKQLAKKKKDSSSTELVVRKKKNYRIIFKETYIKFFYPLEYLLGEYIIIITNYNELFSNIKDDLYFDIEIYNRLRSKDSNIFSCTFAYVSYQILNIEDIDEEDKSIQVNFIEAFREFCDKTSFSNDSSASATLAALRQSLPRLEGTKKVQQLLTGTSSKITSLNNDSGALVEYSQAAANARENAKKAREKAQKAREENEKARQKNKINRLFQEIQKKVQDNRELTLEELRSIRAIKEGLNKELIGTNNTQEIQNYLTQLNINKQISKEERRLRELEIVKILNTANKLPNDIPILDIKKMKDELIKIKENNKNILTESNNEIIDELIKKFKSIYNKSTNSSTFKNKSENFKANKNKYINSEDLEQLKEFLEKVNKLLKIQGITDKNKKELKLEKRVIKERIALLEQPNLQGIVSSSTTKQNNSNSKPKSKSKKDKKQKSESKPEPKSWIEKQRDREINILYDSFGKNKVQINKNIVLSPTNFNTGENVYDIDFENFIEKVAKLYWTFKQEQAIKRKGVLLNSSIKEATEEQLDQTKTELRTLVISDIFDKNKKQIMLKNDILLGLYVILEKQGMKTLKYAIDQKSKDDHFILFTE